MKLLVGTKGAIQSRSLWRPNEKIGVSLKSTVGATDDHQACKDHHIKEKYNWNIDVKKFVSNTLAYLELI